MHPPSTLGLSKFYFNKCLVKRRLSEYEPDSATPLLKTAQPLEKSQAPRQGRLAFLTGVSVAPASAPPHMLFCLPGATCSTCAHGQPFSGGRFQL